MTRRFLPIALALVLQATPAAYAQQFGGSLALSGGQVLVGESTNQTKSGIIWVYGERDGAWTEVDQITVSDEVRVPDGFGRVFVVADDLLLAGAPLEGAGAVYVFRADGSGGWERAARLTPSDASIDAGFGSAIAMGDEIALISAPEADGGRGRVYAFELTARGAWSERESLRPIAGATTQGFGRSLAADGQTLLVSTADGEDASSVVYAFEHAATGGWVNTGRLEAPLLPERSGFGSAIAVQDGVAFVGAPDLGDRVGAVLVYARDEVGEWAFTTRLGPLNAGPSTRFGSFITFDAETVVIGAPGGSNGVGTLYAYGRDGAGDWTSASVIAGSPLEERANFARMAVIGEDLAVVGATGLDSGSGAAVVYERTSSGAWIERGTLINEMRGFPAIAGGEIECADSRAGAFECRDVNVTAFMPIKDLGGTRGTRVNDVWGWTDPDTGREIAIVGRTNGTSFVDISDPYNPRFLGDLPATEGSRHMIWRDIKVYRDHAYIVADAALEHGVQVFDLRQLREVRGDPVTFEETYLYDEIHSAHNIVINEETGFAYAVGSSGGGETCGGGLHMISLEDPARPTFAGCFAQEGTGRRGTGYAHDAQCVIYHGPDTEHVGKEICLGSNETALSIADVTDKEAPVGISTMSYPNVAYAHQGWLTDDHRYFYMNDEGDEPRGLVAGRRTLVWDVTDLDDPVLVKEHIAETTATDHNLYIVGDLMYQSNYSAGFRVLDISDPEDPVEIGFFDTSPYEGGAAWSNYPFFESGIIAVTGTGDGLFLLKNMAKPRLVP